MINFFTTLWTFLNGKKTAIGAACLFISSIIINQWLVSINHVDLSQHNWHWLAVIQTNLDWIGGILTPVGIIHKLTKPTESLNDKASGG